MRYVPILDSFSFHDQTNGVADPAMQLLPSFGLKDTSPNRWQKFRDGIDELKSSDSTVKVIFFGRHGQGHHNVAESKYGTKAWDDCWAKLNGDGESVWGPDPELTSIGEDQARAVQAAWKEEIVAGLPLPEKFYCSPLRRAIRTCELTFGGLVDLQKRRVVVLENCREEIGDHTCDKRSTKSQISSYFSFVDFEGEFSEEDRIWTGVEGVQETHAEVEARVTKVLDHIVAGPETYISVTAHGGLLKGVMRVTGIKPYTLPTGGVIPVVLRAEV